MAQVLIADTADGVINLQCILDGRHDLTTADTIQSAIAELQQRTFDLIIVGVHFDESRAFDLIPRLSHIPRNVDTPIICFCSRDTEMTRTMHRSLDLCSRVLGAWMYLDQHEYNVLQNPNAELCRVIERCLTQESRKEALTKRIDIHQQREEIHQLRLKLEVEQWSPELDDRLGDLRRRLSKLLLRLYQAYINGHAQQETISISRDLKDRLSDSAITAENEMTKSEDQLWIKETQQAIREQEIVDREEGKGQKERHKASKQHESSKKNE